jgi:O-antigen/teichoic acid export membrane protein
MIVVMLFLAMTAEPLVITLVGEKWSQSILYLKLLTVIGFMYPLHALNLNMILVLGRSDLFFRLEIIKKLIAIPILLFFMQYSISIMIYGLWIINFISYFINAYWSKKLIDYSILNQILDIKQFFFFTLIFVLILGGINTFLPVSLFWKFILSMVSIPGLVYFLLKYTNPDFFEELKQLFFVLVK